MPGVFSLLELVLVGLEALLALAGFIFIGGRWRVAGVTPWAGLVWRGDR